MQRTHALAAKLDLDFCNEHGTWYDRNEMESIARTLENARWQTKQQTSADAVNPGTRNGGAGSDTKTLDTVIDGAGIAIDILDSVDTGGEVVGGVFDFFGSLFD